MKRLAFLVSGAAVWLACANAADNVGFRDCLAGEERGCTCENGTPGSQKCDDVGQYAACVCTATLPTGDAAPANPTCGDNVCNGTDTCRNCAHDCGECGKCLYAPSCTDAVGVPANPALRGDLSIPPAPVGDAGTDGGTDAGTGTGSNSCKDPELRFRIQSIKSYDGGGQIYCIIRADDGATSEAAVTTKTKDLKNGESNFFDTTTGIYWGQKGLSRTTNNLTVTFDCFLVKSDSWSKVLGAVGSTATSLGGTPTPYGWAFGLGALAANAAAAGVAAAAGDELRFNAQQTLDKKEMLDLTNGRTWTIRKSYKCSGLLCGGSWDWEIKVQSWGCADADPVKPQ